MNQKHKTYKNSEKHKTRLTNTSPISIIIHRPIPQPKKSLQLVGQVDNLVVDRKLLAMVRNDKNTDGTGPTAKRLLQTAPKVALVNDLKTLLDLSGLGHSDELTVIADIDETVLLEHWAEKAVENNRRGGVGDNARLLMQLLGEEIHTEVSVLAGLCRGGDADDLAGPVLEDHEIADTDVVAGDGESGGLGRMDGGDGCRLVGGNELLCSVGGVRDGPVLIGVDRSLILVVLRVVLAHFCGGLLVLGERSCGSAGGGRLGRLGGNRDGLRDDSGGFPDDLGLGNDGGGELVYGVGLFGGGGGGRVGGVDNYGAFDKDGGGVRRLVGGCVFTEAGVVKFRAGAAGR